MLCACWFNLPLSAQPPQGRFSPKEYAKELEAFIAQQACLSPSEADAFFPLFHEMRNKQRAINWEIIEMKRQKPTPNASDKDFYNLIKNITNLKTESIELEGEYYKKIVVAFGVEKFLQVGKTKFSNISNITNFSLKKSDPIYLSFSN